MKKKLKKLFYNLLFTPLHVVACVLGCVFYIGRLANEKARIIDNKIIKLEKGK